MLIGIHVVRNEADVLGQVLRHAARLHDLILAVDVCSDDDSAGLIRDVSHEHPHVVLIGELDEPIRAEMVRPHVWSAFRDSVPEGSWWSIVDGDEFAEDDLASRIRAAEAEGADHIQGAFATFAYLESEAEAWRRGEEGPADRARPIEERRRHYKMNAYSERLFREHPRLRWDESTYSPRGLLRPWSRRAHYRHYQHRDLAQLRERLETRKALALSEEFLRVHYHWHYSVEEALAADGDPGLRLYTPGEALVPDETLDPVWVRDPVRRFWLWLSSTWDAARNPQPPSRFFGDLPVAEILSRARVDRRHRS